MGTSWHRIEEPPAEGRVRTAIVDGRSIAVTRCGGTVGALDNHCPHQGGPLGEGSIENGLLRCPWHGYDYDPHHRPFRPAGFSDRPRIAFPVAGARRRGVRGDRAARQRAAPARTVSDVIAETLVEWGMDTAVFGMVGHSNLGFADALRRARRNSAPCASSGSVTKARRRSRRRPTASSPAVPLRASGSPGRDPPTCSRACTTPRLDRAPVLADLRSGAVEGAGSGCLPRPRSGRCVPQMWPATRTVTVHVGIRPRRAGRHGHEARHRRSRGGAPDPAGRGAGPAVRTGHRCGVTGRRVDIADARISPPAEPFDAGRLDPVGVGPTGPCIVVGHRGPRVTWPRADRELAESAGRAGAHDLQGQGAACSDHAPAGLPACWVAAARPVASWLMNESDLLVVVRRVVLEPHRHRGRTSRSSRSTSTRRCALGRFHPVAHGAAAGPRRR